MNIKKRIFFIFFVVVLILKVYANQKNIYFFFQDQFLVIYNEDSNKLFVDLNSGFVIKPDDQEKKIKFVEYILDTKSFISRDEDVFTKLYIFKKSINFDFSEVEPADLDYYSWGPLTYKYFAIFCKKVNDSMTIRIPSFEQLSEEVRRDIIDRYRLVFGTSFNEPRYLPYDITIKNVSFNRNVGSEIYETEKTLYDEQKIEIFQTTTNLTIVTTNLTTTTFYSSTSKDNRSYLEIHKRKEFIIILFLIAGISLIVILGLIYRKFLAFRSVKIADNKADISSSLAGTSLSSTEISDGNLWKISQDEIKKITNEINSLREKVDVLENRLTQMESKVSELEGIISKKDLSSKESELNEMESKGDNSFVFPEYVSQSEKLLNKDSLEVVMFKIDNLVNKIKKVEIYREYDINTKASKIIQELYNLKAKIRNTKTVNFNEWDSLVKDNIIDLLSTLDRYLKRIGPNENINKLKKEIMDDSGIEEIYIVPGQTKVNIIDHRVEGYSRNPNLPAGVITEVKEEGYKYKGITIKRAKVIENKP